MSKANKESDWHDVCEPPRFGFAEAAADGGLVTGFNQGPFYLGPEQAAKDAAARVEAFVRTNLPKVRSEDHRAVLEAQLKAFQPSLYEFAQLIEPWRTSEPTKFQIAYQAIWTLVNAASILGTSAAWAPDKDVNKFVEGTQALTAREANIGQATARKSLMQKAIKDVCVAKGLKMKATLTFAERIREDVCKEIGVDPNKRGYSARTMHRVIETILKNAEIV